MKTLLTTLVAICLFNLACSAQWTLSGANIYPTTLTNNVGINTTTPENGFKLDVNGLGAIGTQGSARIYMGTTDATHAFFQSRNNTVNQNLTFSASSYNFSVGNVGIGTANALYPLTVIGPTSNIFNASDGTRGVLIQAQSTPTSNGGVIGYYNGIYNDLDIRALAGTASQLYLKTNGKVGVGTANPDQLFTVNGNIHAKSVIVDLSIVPDYVFKPTYKLPSLDYVKNYVEKNSHLPEVPSEAQIKKDGLDVGAMNAILLKKVEELTLYMIEKDKQIKQLQTQVKELQKRKK